MEEPNLFEIIGRLVVGQAQQQSLIEALTKQMDSLQQQVAAAEPKGDGDVVDH